MTIELTPNPQRTAPGAPSDKDVLLRILERLESIENRLARLEPPGSGVPSNLTPEVERLAAMVGDIVDAQAAQLQSEGVDIDATLRGLMAFGRTLSQPEVLSALKELTERLPQLAELAAAGPKLAAMGMDAFDELASEAAKRGFEFDSAVGSLLTVGLRLSEVLESPQFRALFESGVLAPETLEVIGRAGEALSEQSASNCGRTGVLGAIGATADADIQRAVHFAIGFARRFGARMDGPVPVSDPPKLASNSHNA